MRSEVMADSTLADFWVANSERVACASVKGGAGRLPRWWPGGTGMLPARWRWRTRRHTARVWPALPDDLP